MKIGVWGRLAGLGVLFAVAWGATPAIAYTNMSGVWSADYGEDWPDRIPGPELGDYGGLPLNDADRLHAKSWDASLIALPEYQCRVHPSDYANSFADIRIWEERDRHSQKLVAIHLHHFAWSTERTIWMDGRPHPPEYALHTAMGFSTGEYKGHVLVVKTDHLSEGWLRRNGVDRSDKATVTEYFVRHGDHLIWTVVIHDPTYLDADFVRNRDYLYSDTNQIGAYPCESVVEIVRPKGYIPHHFMGDNPFLKEYAINHRIPFEAAMGGAKTMYPEYMKEIRKMPLPPPPKKGEGDTTNSLFGGRQ